MRILLVNDDGIESPGLAALARAAVRFGEVWVVAPETQCSGMSQRLTLFDEMPLHKAAFPVPVKAAWSLGGSPADCVKVALEYLLDFRPDYVFSGVNDGWNAGFDVAYSGTIGACYEAVMNGVPAIAFSSKSRSDMEIAEAYMPQLARELIALGQEPGEIWNVNFPAGPLSALRGILRERRIAPMQLYNGVFSSRVHPEGYRMLSQQGVPIGRGVAPEGSDIAAVLDGYISVGKIMSPVM
jgi:5'-nucleotidase